MPLSDATKELVAQITEAAKLEGFDIDWVDAGGASDGNHMAEAGLPVIDGCGPSLRHSRRTYSHEHSLPVSDLIQQKQI